MTPPLIIPGRRARTLSPSAERLIFTAILLAIAGALLYAGRILAAMDPPLSM